MNYYNEWDKGAAQWLRNLIAAGLIPPGDVDDRSITDVRAEDLRGYTQCHFFAGIGGWDRALQIAGWPHDRPAWTGSCPCQPFSSAGKGRGVEDERHLWPEFARLIRECNPPVVFGEQVASRAGRDWLSDVRADLEAMGYAVGAADLCAAGVGAPHIRQRLYWVADAQRWPAERRGYDLAAAQGCAESEARQRQRVRDELGSGSDTGSVADAEQWRRESRGVGSSAPQTDQPPTRSSVGNPDNPGLEGREPAAKRGGELPARSAGLDDHWSDIIWLPCSDGKARPAQPGIQPLAHGVPGRVVRLRAYGNAIVPQVGAAFVRAYLEVERSGARGLL